MATQSTKLELAVEKLVYGGDGLARREREVVLLPYVLPGETVQAQLDGRSRGVTHAKPLRVLTSAAERTDPGCRFFGRCGGCHYQHASYPMQLAQKRQILAETLRRIGKITPPEEIAIVAAEPWGYRNRTQLHVDQDRIGFHEPSSNKLCAVEDCPISSPKLNQALASLREMTRDSRWPQFLRSLELFTNESEVQLNILETGRPLARRFFDWAVESIPGADAGALEYSACAFEFRVSARSFFQVNRFLLDQLVELAVGDHASDSALDLYAGVGLFSLPMARRFHRVTAVESNRTAVEDLRFNAERAEVAVEAVQVSVESFLESCAAAPDLVLADPPRSGLGKHVVARLAELRPPRITIVSCEPTTLARDLSPLLASGYRIEKLHLVDLFPQTYHIESVVCLRLSA